MVSKFLYNEPYKKQKRNFSASYAKIANDLEI